MTQHVTEHDVRDIAEYTRIGLTDEEVSQMTVDLNAIIDSLAPITEYDLEGVEPTFHPVSYTHLDVYKRQVPGPARQPSKCRSVLAR